MGSFELEWIFLEQADIYNPGPIGPTLAADAESREGRGIQDFVGYNAFEVHEANSAKGKYSAIEAINLLSEAECKFYDGKSMRYSHDERRAIHRALVASTWTYFIVAPDVGMVKIGKAKNLKKRLATLRTGCPVPIEVRAAVRFTEGLEGWLHDALKDKRRDGEWFVYDEEMAEVVMCAKHGGTNGFLSFAVEKGYITEDQRMASL